MNWRCTVGIITTVFFDVLLNVVALQRLLDYLNEKKRFHPWLQLSCVKDVMHLFHTSDDIFCK